MFTQDRLGGVLREVGVDAPGNIFSRLAAAYGSPGRFYHTEMHIADCLEQLDGTISISEHPAALELAIWFHDAVYDTRANDNEAQSAAWAEGFLRSHGVSADIIERIVRMILVTQTHADLRSADEMLLVDIDLSILGRPPAQFEAYDAAIRREYAWVPDAEYREGRAAVLEGFINRRTIYNTDCYREIYEQPARRNLASLIAALRS